MSDIIDDDVIDVIEEQDELSEDAVAEAFGAQLIDYVCHKVIKLSNQVALPSQTPDEFRRVQLGQLAESFFDAIDGRATDLPNFQVIVPGNEEEDEDILISGDLTVRYMNRLEHLRLTYLK